MAGDDEEDYMSDAFLLGLGDSRPGLVSDRVAKVHQKEAKRKKKERESKTKPLKLRETEHRDVGLSNAIDSSNKGFALLQKMGYKKGQGLGKSEEGRTEPIPLSIKAGRGGLGQESELKRKQAYQQRIMKVRREKRARMEQIQWKDFRAQQKERFSNRQIEKDLLQSQKACEQLDKAKNMIFEEEWFWPTMQQDEGEDGEDENDLKIEELTSSEKLVMLTEYLRTVHCYCIWCGSTYTDVDDLLANCPGDNYTAHDE